MKKKIQFGATLKRIEPVDNNDRAMPLNIVEARRTVKYMDDGF